MFLAPKIFFGEAPSKF